jgi:hypothetical protein
MRGLFAIKVGKFLNYELGEYSDIIESSPINCKNVKEAIADAENWAKSEGLEFRGKQK